MQEVENFKIVNYVDEDKALDILRLYPHAIEWVDNPTDKMIEFCVRHDPSILVYVKNPSERAKALAVKRDGNCIAYIEEPSRRIQQLAIRENPSSVVYLKKPSLDVLAEALEYYDAYIENCQSGSMREVVAKTVHGTIKDNITMCKSDIMRILEFVDVEKDISDIRELLSKHPSAIQYVKDASEDLWLYAIRKNPNVIKHCENQTERMKKCAVSRMGFTIMHCNDPSVDVMKLAVKKSPETIMLLQKAPQEVRSLAISRNPQTYRNIKNPTEEDSLEYVKHKKADMVWLRSRSTKVLVAAVTTDPTRLCTMLDLPDEAIEAAIRTFPHAVGYLNGYIPEKFQKLAIDTDPSSIYGIDNPSKTIQQYAADAYNKVNKMWTSSEEIVAKEQKTKNGVLRIVIGAFEMNHATRCAEGINRKKYWLWKIDYVNDGVSGTFFANNTHRFANKKNAIKAAQDVLDDWAWN